MRSYTLPVALTLALVGSLTGCDDFAPTFGDRVTSPDADALPGLWIGTEYVSGAWDAPGEGFSFRVALQLSPGGTFVLRSVDYPPASAETQPVRYCTGVYALVNRTLEFFPDGVCPALPLNRFGVGSSGSRLLLEAVHTQTISVRVKLDLERT